MGGSSQRTGMQKSAVTDMYAQDSGREGILLVWKDFWGVYNNTIVSLNLHVLRKLNELIQ